jgi:tetratricopeptide (TPR) repeat protein
VRRKEGVEASGNAAVAVGGDVIAPILTNPTINISLDSPNSQPSPPIILPPSVSDFTGRSEEIRKVECLTSGEGPYSGAIVISGRPGVGKTALAVYLAHRIKDDLGGGAFYADLRGQDKSPVPADGIMARVMMALGASEGEIPTPLDSRLDAYRDLMSRQNGFVLVLDNAANEGQVRHLIQQRPNVLTIITSRNQLAGLEDLLRIDLDDLQFDESIDFLERVVGCERVNRDRDAAAAVVQLCSGLPLALRIAANRLISTRTIRLSDLARELRSEESRLDHLSIGDLAIRAAFKISYSHLGKAARRAFRLLSCAPGEDFGVGICSALTGYSQRDASKCLRKLTEANLIERSVGLGRYRFHDLLKIYASHELAKREASELDASVARMTDWLMHTTLTAALMLAAQRAVDIPSYAGEEIQSLEEASAWTKDEFSSALACIDRLGEVGSAKRALEWATFLSIACEVTGQWRNWEQATALGLELSRRFDSRYEEIVFLIGMANLHRSRREFQQSLHVAQEAHALAKEIDDDNLTAQTANILGCVSMDLGMNDDAFPYLEESQRLFEKIGAEHEVAKVQYNLGTIQRAAGNTEEAIGLFEKDLKMCLKLGDWVGAAETMNTIAIAYQDLGSFAEAEPYHRRALEMFQKVDNPDKVGMALNDLGVTLRAQGRYEESLEVTLKSLDISSQINDVSGVAVAQGNAADTLRILGNYEEALRYFRDASDALVKINDKARLGRCLTGQIPLLFELDEIDQARERAFQAIEILHSFGELRDVADVYRTLAACYEEAGVYDKALECIDSALNTGSFSPHFRGICFFIGLLASGAIGDVQRFDRYWSMWLTLAEESPSVMKEMEALIEALLEDLG